MQMALLHDLLFIAMEEDVNIQAHSLLDFKITDHQTIFAVSLYHRWVLKAYMNGALITKQARVPFIPMPGVQDPNLTAASQRDMIRSQLDAQIMASVELISKILFEVETMTVPTIDSFVHLSEETVELKTKWEVGVRISPEEFKCQFHYEMGSFSFFREDYANAKQHFTECYKFYQALEKNKELRSKVKFCCIDKEKLFGYCRACDVKIESSDDPTDLHEKFKLSVKNEFKGIMQILQMDNLRHEIPLVDRDMLEVDIQVASCSCAFTVAKDLLLKIQILNFLRRAVTNEVVNVNFVQTLQNGGDKGIEFFLSSLKPLIFEGKDIEKENLKYFVFDLMLRDLTWSERSMLAPVLLKDDLVKGLFTSEEIIEIEMKMGTGKNDLDEVISSYSVDVPLQLISSK